MKHLLMAGAVVALALAGAPARAQDDPTDTDAAAGMFHDVTISTLYAACGSELISAANQAARLMCDGYIAGIADLMKMPDGVSPSACIPAGTAPKAVRFAVLSYLGHDLDHGDWIAAPGVVYALHEAFPCKGGAK